MCPPLGGIYSVLSYIVRGRSREIGIRRALGARTGDGVRMVIPEGIAPTVIGIAAVGIVGDVKQGELSEPAMATVYEYSQENDWRYRVLVARTSGPPASLAQAATTAIRDIDPEQPVRNILSMDEVVDQTLTSQRFSAFVLGLFASLALVLASIGIYSVLSYIVRGRSREIGIRRALGARTGDVVRMVILEGIAPTVIGIAAGVIAALASAKLLEKLVFGVSASDPLTLVAVIGTLTLVALIASLAPALRASRLDPIRVLRAD